MPTPAEIADAVLDAEVDNALTAAAGDRISIRNLLRQTHRQAFFASLTTPAMLCFQQTGGTELWLDLGTARRVLSPAQAAAITAAAVTRRDPRDPKAAAVVDPRLVVTLPADDPFWQLPVYTPTPPPPPAN